MQLDSDLGIGEGVEVEIVVRPVQRQQPWGERIKQSAGAMANLWSEEDDRILEELREDRTTSRGIPE